MEKAIETIAIGILLGTAAYLVLRLAWVVVLYLLREIAVGFLHGLAVGILEELKRYRRSRNYAALVKRDRRRARSRRSRMLKWAFLAR